MTPEEIAANFSLEVIELAIKLKETDHIVREVGCNSVKEAIDLLEGKENE